MPAKKHSRGRDLAKEIRHRINAGRVAVQAQVDFFRDQLGRVSCEFKEDETPVTFADYAISEKVMAAIIGDFPEDIFCSEESNPADEAIELESSYAWIIDPIDGTKNFADGYPVCAISLALLLDGVPIYGFIYDLTRDVLMEGGPRHGVIEKRKKLKVEFPEVLNRQTTIGLHFPMKTEILEKLNPLMQTYRVRSLGSAALAAAYTSNGLLDGVIDYKVSVWDVAAAYALVLGAGGEFHFLEDSIFPLKRFHVNQGKTPFYAGSLTFCRYVESLLA